MTSTPFEPRVPDPHRPHHRDLDIWLAEHLLGWPLETVRFQTFHADTHTLVPALSFLDRLAFTHVLPALAERAWDWTLRSFPGSGMVTCTLHRAGAVHAEAAETVALAVARAARAAVQGERHPPTPEPDPMATKQPDPEAIIDVG